MLQSLDMKKLDASWLAATAGAALVATASLAQAPRPRHAPSHEAVAPAGQAAAGTEVLAFERDIAAAIVRGDVAYMDKAIAPDFVMVHGDGWTEGDAPALVDDRASFMKRVSDKIYAAIDYDAQAVEMHGDVAITYGHYVGHIPGSPPGRRWFSVWYEKVYAERDGRWVYLSHRTVDGAHYGTDRESASLR
jgi:Domain of unknown function (DUF4440)